MKSITKATFILLAAILFLLSPTACSNTSEIAELKEKVEELESQLEPEESEPEEDKEEVIVESDEIEYYKDKIEIINLEMAQIMDDLYEWIAKRSKNEISEEDLFDMVFSVPIYIDETYAKFLRIQTPDEMENIHSIYQKAF